MKNYLQIFHILEKYEMGLPFFDISMLEYFQRFIRTSAVFLVVFSVGLFYNEVSQGGNSAEKQGKFEATP